MGAPRHPPPPPERASPGLLAMANDVSSSLERFWVDLFSAVLLFAIAIGG